MRLLDKTSFTSTSTTTMILSIMIVFVIIYFVYHLFSSTTEVYYYYVEEFNGTSKILTMEKDKTYTNYIHAKLYDKQHNHVGEMSSVNFHQIIAEKNRVTTLTTYITKNGSITCNLLYETTPDTHYLYGKIEDIITEHETGMYKGKTVALQLNGKQDGEREITIKTSKKWF